jgi:AcrR family transcriptional regulator
MPDTKEKILQAALRLFARDGYEAVPVSAIAAEVGVTKPALYKHYKSKRDIFDHIVARMAKTNKEKAKDFGVPVGTFANSAESSHESYLAKIKDFSLSMFKFWTEDEFASSFRRMLTIEQYRNLDMAALLYNYLTGGIIEYATDLIREAATGKISKEKNPKILALYYFAPIYLMMNLHDTGRKEEAISFVEEHINGFMELLKI